MNFYFIFRLFVMCAQIYKKKKKNLHKRKKFHNQSIYVYLHACQELIQKNQKKKKDNNNVIIHHHIHTQRYHQMNKFRY
jgi:predicted HicB family RNase H-like nuclease